MDKGKLIELREKIVSESLPSVMEQLGDKESRFNMILKVIQAGTANNPELLNEAFGLANSIEDKDVKVDALMRLLDEVNFQIDAKEHGLDGATGTERTSETVVTEDAKEEAAVEPEAEDLEVPDL